MFSYDTWMFIFAAAGAIAAPFAIIGGFYAMLQYIRPTVPSAVVPMESSSVRAGVPRGSRGTLIAALLLAALSSAGLLALVFYGRHVVSVIAQQSLPTSETVRGIKWSVLENPPLSVNKDAAGNTVVLGFSLYGISISNDPIQLDDAYITSGVTGEKKSLMVASRNEIPPNGIKPLVFNTELQLVCHFGNNGIAAEEFLREWSIIKVTVKYMGAQFHHTFSGDQIRARLADMRPQPVAR